MTSNQESDSVSQCPSVDAYTWRTILILPNFIPIRLEVTEPYTFSKRSLQEGQEQDERVPDLKNDYGNVRILHICMLY